MNITSCILFLTAMVGLLVIALIDQVKQLNNRLTKVLMEDSRKWAWMESVVNSVNERTSHDNADT